MTGDDGPVEPINPNPLAMKCTDAFKVSGTFTPSTARPADLGGCWPAGTWRFSLTSDPTMENILDVTGDKMPDRCGQVAGTVAATPKASYEFVATRTDDGDGYVDNYTVTAGQGLAPSCASPGDCVFRMSISEDGARECEAGLELFSADRTMYWNLRPNQETGSPSIEGIAEFTLYLEAQTI